ncbi:YraN family protein [Candidimonas sp. SYP-B2681]|uniref:YraN family protein n=1 Tax=Candidimonas sp. SYP-B2681 TaxID=2497686 RepID=UPI000F88B8E2|nr:YraN family protein [Candidimonas sp. SYP-B2681]RTZ43128.1 YraN family protein [Candidimonas sp. SYP-B2681]
MADDQRLYELARLAQQKAAKTLRRRANAQARKRAHQAATCLPGGGRLTDDAEACPMESAPEQGTRSPTQQAGDRAEDRARQLLQASGLIIIVQNLRSKTGEIDLVAIDRDTLVFIEVRHRRGSHQYGGAAASVNRNKQARLVRTAQFFLPRLSRRYFLGTTPACRFDVITDQADGLSWIKNAFEE